MDAHGRVETGAAGLTSFSPVSVPEVEAWRPLFSALSVLPCVLSTWTPGLSAGAKSGSSSCPCAFLCFLELSRDFAYGIKHVISKFLAGVSPSSSSCFQLGSFSQAGPKGVKNAQMSSGAKRFLINGKEAAFRLLRSGHLRLKRTARMGRSREPPDRNFRSKERTC